MIDRYVKWLFLGIVTDGAKAWEPPIAFGKLEEGNLKHTNTYGSCLENCPLLKMSRAQHNTLDEYKIRAIDLVGHRQWN